MSRLLGFYKTQLQVLWEWRGGRIALLKRLVITLVLSAISFILTAALLPRLRVDSVMDAVLAVIFMALFNAIVRPVVLALAAPISLILVAVLVLVLQILAFFAIATLAPGVHVDAFLTAVIASFIYAIINTILTAIFAVDSGDSFYGLLVQRLMVRSSTGQSDKPGLVILQIDGLAHPILAARMRAGSVNTLASWVRNGTHKLSRWEAILPSMTSASQAGILHGNNDEIPAFRWYERDRQHLMASSNPADATLIVSRISNGEGLLSNNGASVTNLVTGDATRSYFTTASIKAEGGGIGESRAFLPFFFSPSGYLRSFTLFVGEFIKELFQARRTRRSGVQPQMHRGAKYAGMRAASNVILRDVNVALIIEEMYRGTNVIYADFTDYDELAHHCGPERVESFQALDGVDQAIGALVHATENAPRPYKFIVLSDHGQSLGATFKQRYGKSLGEYIRELMGGRATVVQTSARAEGSMFVNAFLSEITRSKGVGPSMARAALSNRTTDGVVNLDSDEEKVEQAAMADESAIAVVGSGNLGLVWFTGNDHRLTVEELEQLHPGLIAAVAAHPGVGLLMVRSKAHGAVVFGPKGTRYLDEDRVEGEDPTTLFGEHTVMSLKREDAMKHAPDLLLLSQYNPDLGEVAAFEELIGSHGGLGGPQTEPFILHPIEWELDEPVPLGAPAIYRNIRRWLKSIGIELGPQTAPAPVPTDEGALEPAPAGGAAG
ncbi:MAG TPA: phage holin family protein [Candidatus Limnocylindrales bacterium]|nr:phage holin family protein [Candidatus Limnocylindrales bacterium]